MFLDLLSFMRAGGRRVKYFVGRRRLGLCGVRGGIVACSRAIVRGALRVLERGGRGGPVRVEVEVLEPDAAAVAVVRRVAIFWVKGARRGVVACGQRGLGSGCTAVRPRTDRGGYI